MQRQEDAMPGGRLTHDDRRQIAAGLADGLGYAEIARRLGRPTSTVTREVNRNGGPGGYRADRAQRVTAQRARRRAPVLAATAPAGDRDTAAVRAVEERMIALFTDMGLPRMESRVLMTLHLADADGHSAAELVAKLRVSPASVSKAIGYLERLDLVRRERDSHHRRERYVIDEDLWLRNWRTSVKQHAEMAELAERAVDLLGPDTAAGARMRMAHQMFHFLSHDMVDFVEERLARLEIASGRNSSPQRADTAPRPGER
jgi:predicted transcriptional regulator